MGLLRVIFRVLLYLPWIWLLLFALFVISTAVQIGGLPAYGQPDPKESTFAFLYVPVMVTLLMVMASTPFGLALAVARLWQGVPKFIRREEVIAYLVGILLFFFVTMSDFAGLMTWLGD